MHEGYPLAIAKKVLRLTSKPGISIRPLARASYAALDRHTTNLPPRDSWLADFLERDLRFSEAVTSPLESYRNLRQAISGEYRRWPVKRERHGPWLEMSSALMTRPIQSPLALPLRPTTRWPRLFWVLYATAILAANPAFAMSKAMF